MSRPKDRPATSSPVGVVLGGSATRPDAFIRARVGGILGLAITAALAPQVGEHRYYLAFLLSIVFTPAVVLTQKILTDPLRDQVQPMLDVLGIVTLIHLVPTAWHAATVVGAGTLATGAFVLTARQRSSLGAILLAGLAFAGWVHSVPVWQLSLLGLAAVTLPAGPYASWYQDRHLDYARRIEVLLESADALLWEVELEPFRAVSVHGRAHEMTGFNVEELAFQFPKLIHPSDIELAQTIGRTSDLIEETLRVRTASGSYRHLKNLGHVSRSGKKRIARGISFDVTELEESKMSLRELSETDALTGLGNRVGLAAFVEQTAQIKGTQVGFLLLDLDGFKLINDTLGHDTGDRLIALIGARLQEIVLRADPAFNAVFRLGGDEFGLICTDNHGERPLRTAVVDYAHAVRDQLGEPFIIDGRRLSVSASIGVAFGTFEQPASELMRNADIAMYAAKRARTGVEVFTCAPEALSSERLQAHSDLASGLETEVGLWFQPVIDTKTGRTVSVEGLARWNHPTRGILEPASFLDLVDDARLTDRFDRQVLALAAKQAARLARGPHRISVAVNLSATSIWSTMLMDFLAALIKQYELDPGSLIVEISERDLVDDHTKILPGLNQLRELGVGLSLDDFGTGYSSLIRLRELPLTELKIDQSFVSRITASEIDRAIVRSTLDLAQSIGMVTVAEGVEDQPTFDLLSEWGCGRMQGYLFSRALPPEDLDVYLRAETALEDQPTVSR
jgi:diguanylate cyclase (GGDEF)-like protein